LNRPQVQTILGRQLSRTEWESVRHQFPDFSNPVITKQQHNDEATLERRKLNQQQQLKKSKTKVVRTQEEIKQLRNQRQQRQRSQLQDEDIRLRNIFRHTNDSTYHVIKVFDEYIPKFKSRRTHWKILGDSNIFNIRSAITDVTNKQT
jgi:hypothetical protein